MEPVTTKSEESGRAGSISTKAVYVDNDPAPLHPFEVCITIGGDSWEYVQRVTHELAQCFDERRGAAANTMSGGAGGSYSVTAAARDISPPEFHKELSDWFARQRSKAN